MYNMEAESDIKCPICGIIFSRSRVWQKFCSDKCRYVFHNKESSVCVYCGELSQSIDHVPPKAARSLITSKIDPGIEFIEVPACLECNSALTDRPLWDIYSRKKFIRKYLARRYKKFLRQKSWSDEELSELGPTLRRIVVNGMYIKNKILSRISYGDA